jgi:hypothetical protein
MLYPTPNEAILSTSYAYIVHRASEAVGLKDFNSEGMEGDDFRKVFLALQDSIRSLNSDPAILFGVKSLTQFVHGSSLDFMPYTDAELAIIAGGGTVDLTDRVVTIRPTIAPMVYNDSNRVAIIDALDIPLHRDKMVCAWLPDFDRDVLQFGDVVNGEIVLQIRTPIPIPSNPQEQLKLPERYWEYLILTLSVALAVKLGLTETLAALKQSLAMEIVRVTSNNVTQRPILLDSSMNRFNRW